MMKILHSADWHLGARLYGKSRREECRALFDAVLDLVRHRSVDCLLITGDLFDAKTPPHEALLDFGHLVRDLAVENCSVVVTSGNHDSPLLLQSLGQFGPNLKTFALTSVQELSDPCAFAMDFDDCTLLAVPFLSPALLGADPTAALIDYYHRAIEEARKGAKGPLIAAGHFTALAPVEGEDSYDLSIGHLDMVPLTQLPPVDCWALGHLHSLNDSLIQAGYAGSPLAFSFSDQAQKSMRLLTVEKGTVAVELVPLTVGHRLRQAKGSRQELRQALKAHSQPAWWSLWCTESVWLGELREELEALLLEGSEIVDLKASALATQDEESELLSDVPDPMWYFDRIMKTEGLEEAQDQRLRNLYQACLEEVRSC